MTETEAQKVYAQAREIFELAESIAVKIPCHKNYYEVIKCLVKEGVRLNITLVFSFLLKCAEYTQLPCKKRCISVPDRSSAKQFQSSLPVEQIEIKDHRNYNNLAYA